MAGPGCQIYAGPAGAPAPVELPRVKDPLGLRLFGVRTANGTVRLEVNGQVSEIPIPGYHVMLGSLCADLGGPVSPIAPQSLVGFVQVWPAHAEPVVARPWLVAGDNSRVDAWRLRCPLSDFRELSGSIESPVSAGCQAKRYRTGTAD